MSPIISIEFNDACVNELESSLALGPIIEVNGKELVQLTEAELDRICGLTVSIYADEHPPPHFHVKYNGEENSFNIITGRPLYPQNGLKRFFRNISKWYNKNRNKLIDEWNRLRPDDCPVGPVIE